MTRLGHDLNLKVKNLNPAQSNIYSINSDAESSEKVTKPKKLVIVKQKNKNESESEFRYWRLIFGIVAAPFLVLGFPIPLLIFSQNKTGASNPKRKSEWFLGILLPRNIFICLSTILLLTISIVLTVYFLTAVWDIFDILVIRGEVTWKFIISIAIVIRTFPAIVPLFVVWLLGYSYRDILTSFDEFRINYISRLTLKPRGKANFKHPVTKIGFWFKLVSLYFAILCIHVIPILADGWKYQHWTSIWIGLLYRFIPPVYCMCCWLLESEFQILSGFLTSILKEDCVITIQTVDEIKTMYKKVTKHVTYVNKKFGKYISWWIFPILGFSTVSHLVAMILFLVGNVSLRTIMFFFGVLGEMDEDRMLESTAVELVRSAAAHTFVGFLELGLIAFMIRQAIAVSDESRFAHVLINEVIGDHSLPVIKNEELYQAMRHLKYYMYMTHEYDNPSLMMLPSIARVPIIGYRLHTSKLQNPPLHRRFLHEIV